MDGNQELGQLINAISVRMRLMRLIQENGDNKTALLNERELLILELLFEQEDVPLSKIAGLWKDLSGSTLSTEVSRLVEKGWATKGILATNQRARTVCLTELGKHALVAGKAHAASRYSLLIKAIEPSKLEREVLERILVRAVDFIDNRIRAFASEKERTATSKSH